LRHEREPFVFGPRQHGHRPLRWRGQGARMTSTSPRADWHWPDFGPALCGTLSDRERLGLPEHYVRPRLGDALKRACAEQRGESVTALMATLASPHATLAQRISSGNLLALCGDPRISTLQPTMADIPGGRVLIGLEADEVAAVLSCFAGLGLDRSWIEKECPRHSVSLEAFRLARYPITNGEYRDFLLESGYPELPSSWAFRQFPQTHANHPVYTVSATAADAYAQWLAQRTGRRFRLPTEAEWEWAAGGPQALEFPWGTNFDADLANTAETGLFDTAPVGAFVGGDSAFGIADMAGQVEEYVAGDYAAYPGGTAVADHLVQIHGAYRVARGGSFARFRDLARTRRRHGHNPRSATYAMGFRVAESL
jgi:formylglycine-generating enzyme required for sulfatase activity